MAVHCVVCWTGTVCVCVCMCVCVCVTARHTKPAVLAGRDWGEPNENLGNMKRKIS